MILATRSVAKTFQCRWEAGWCFHSNLFYGNSGAKFRKEEGQRIGNQIDAAMMFAGPDFVNGDGMHRCCPV